MCSHTERCAVIARCCCRSAVRRSVGSAGAAVSTGCDSAIACCTGASPDRNGVCIGCVRGTADRNGVWVAGCGAISHRRRRVATGCAGCPASNVVTAVLVAYGLATARSIGTTRCRVRKPGPSAGYSGGADRRNEPRRSHASVPTEGSTCLDAIGLYTVFNGA